MGGGLLPRVVENMLDAKSELDGRLRTVINDTITSFAKRILGPLADRQVGKGGFDAAAAVQAARRATEKEALLLREKLNAYLDDVRIKETLVEAVHEQLMQHYRSFYESHRQNRQTNGKAVSSKGKGREDEVWDPEMFSEWAARVFDIGEAGVDDVDEDNEIDSSDVSRAGSI